MLKTDIVEGVYLKQAIERYGLPAGLIGVVHQVTTDWTGEWMFQFHYLNPPADMRNKPVLPWSLTLREKDLADFDLIGTWTAARVLLESPPYLIKPKKGSKLPARSNLRHLGWRKKWHPNQLRLFKEF